ncbi:hypothetical protein N7475_002940 [Penicillium sp. IBT 31633x]|nr:hypothetical protein N7475_002940 [Penicillium sp. IBT 31633x]
MRSALLTVLCTLLLLGTISSAWPWRPYGALLGGDSLEKRQDTTDTTNAETSEATATASTASETARETDNETATGTGTGTGTNTNTNTRTNTATDSETTTGRQTGTETGKKKTTATTSISIDPAAAAGGVSMITPGSKSTTYYKIGQDVTFVWNYTSLSVTPSAVNVVASCALNSIKYTLTSNMTVQQTGKVVWDTGKYQATATEPLLTASYTLIIYDASKEIGDIASAGHLSSQNGYPFGMYAPQSYTPLNEFHCATCSGALSETTRQALKFTVGMAVVTVASFTWFAGSAGLFTI